MVWNQPLFYLCSCPLPFWIQRINPGKQSLGQTTKLWFFFGTSLDLLWEGTAGGMGVLSVKCQVGTNPQR